MCILGKLKRSYERKSDPHKDMFSTLRDAQDVVQLDHILHSFHLIRKAVYAEECKGVMTRCVFEKH